MRFETIAIKSGGELDEEFGSVSPPIHLSTTFELSPDSKQIHGYRYAREANPTQTRLEEALSALDGGEAALAFASGMGAGAALLQALPAGSHIILPDDSYYAFRILARDFLEPWGYSYELVDMTDLDAVDRSLGRDKALLWAETPSNPLMRVVDLRALAERAAARGARLVVDSTFATPALQRPIECGADIVLHSSTKYLGGHSDVTGGALVFRKRDELFDRVQHARRLVGAVASPFSSWLVLRGIRTLAARMRVHSENARRVAELLASHANVEAVHYPGLSSHPGHAVARRQMSDFGGMLSFRVKGDRQATIDVVGRTRLFIHATSLGGFESLIEHRWSTEGAGSTTPDNLIRCSIGLEHPDDLIDDLAQALGG